MTHKRSATFFLTSSAALAVSACAGGTERLGDATSFAPPPPALPVPPAHLGLVSAAPFAVLATGDTFTTDAQGQHPTIQSDPSAKDVRFSYDVATDSYQITLPGFQSGTLANTSWGGSAGQAATGSISQVTMGPSKNLQAVSITMPVPGSESSPYASTSFGSWTGQLSGDTSQTVRGEGFFAYGIPTAGTEMPVTGSASYTAQIIASRGLNSSPEVGGDVSLMFNFASGTLTGFMHPKIEDSFDGIFIDFGRYDFTQTVYSSGATTFSGKFNVPGLPNADSSFNGNFTGPNAAELMARFQAPYLAAGQQGMIAGVWVGKKN